MSRKRNIHEVLEGLQEQLVGESVLYSINTTPWGGTPTGTDHDIFDEEDLTTSLKSAMMSGSSSVSADVINLPALGSVVAGKIYRVEVTFTSLGNTLVGYFRVEGK